MLVSRVACLGKLVHQPRGYSGPLSRHLLAYHAIIASVQAALRDLVEMSVVTMFLEGYAARDRDDWMEIALTYRHHRLQRHVFHEPLLISGQVTSFR